MLVARYLGQLLGIVGDKGCLLIGWLTHIFRVGVITGFNRHSEAFAG
jgi:hypothetical protein